MIIEKITTLQEFTNNDGCKFGIYEVKFLNNAEKKFISRNKNKFRVLAHMSDEDILYPIRDEIKEQLINELGESIEESEVK